MCRFGSVNLQRMKSEFNRKNKNFLKYIPLIAIPRLLPELSKQLSLDLHNILLKAAKSKSKACKNQEKYANYFTFSRNLQELADHQYLAVLRGDKEKALSTSFTIVGGPWNVRNSIASGVIAQTFGKAILAEKQLSKAIMEGLLDKFSSMELRRLKALRKKRAEDGSCSVFRSNLKALLLQTPLKARNIIAIDPGFANGCKCAVIDKQGKPLKFRKLFLRKKDDFMRTLEGFIADFSVDIIGVGDGQGSREAEAIVASLVSKLEQRGNSNIKFCTVREAGVSVYSCSPIAAKEFPDLEPAERSAISLARRLLDPMTELVKVSPENLGVGQYQHDINAKKLSEALDDAVEQSVSFVGVDLNTTGEHLLARVAGVGAARAKKIVAHRNEKKEFKNIEGIKDVKGFGAKSFKQAAGFLRVYGGDNKLDQTWIHPESYHLAKKVLRKLKMKIEDIGTDRLNLAASRVTPEDFDIEEETAKMIIDAFRNCEEDVRKGIK